MAKTAKTKLYNDVILKITGKRKQEEPTKEQLQSFDELSWYIGVKFRREAETILLEYGIHGMYLLRKSPRHNGYAISVRYSDIVKHFFLDYDEVTERLCFGPEIFSTINEFVGYMESQPTINHLSDDAICLKFPYIRPYEDSITGKEPKVQQKEGFLLKRGAIHKNWKYRWFVVRDDVMKYFSSRLDERPLREVDISTATEVSVSEIDDKEICFCLVTPARTFYFESQTREEQKSWINFFKARIDYNKQR